MAVVVVAHYYLQLHITITVALLSLSFIDNMTATASLIQFNTFCYPTVTVKHPVYFICVSSLRLQFCMLTYCATRCFSTVQLHIILLTEVSEHIISINNLSCLINCTYTIMYRIQLYLLHHTYSLFTIYMNGRCKPNFTVLIWGK